MRDASTQNDPPAAQTLDWTRVSDLLRKLAKYRPAQEITDYLENERSRRRQLMWIGVPAQVIFFGVGLAYSNSNYVLIELLPLAMQAAAAEAKQINMAYRDARTLRGF
jgi:hypothetical protein